MTRPDGWVVNLSLDPYEVSFDEYIEDSPPGSSQFRLTIDQFSLPEVQGNSSATPGRVPPEMKVGVRFVVGESDWNDFPYWIFSICYTSFNDLYGLFTCDLANLDRPWGEQSYEFLSDVFAEDQVKAWVRKANASDVVWEYWIFTPGDLAYSCSVYLDNSGQIVGPFNDAELDPRSRVSCPSVTEIG